MVDRLDETQLNQYPLYENGGVDRHPLYDDYAFENSEAGDAVKELSWKQGREVLDRQIETLSDTDDKAIKIFRINVLVAGLILTALSIVARYSATVEQPTIAGTELQLFFNYHAGVGGLLLLLSIALAGLTYTSTAFESGIGSEDIRQSFSNDLDAAEFQELLAEGYTHWVAENDELLEQNQLLVTITIYTVVDAMLFIAVGVAIPLVRPATVENSVLMGIVLLGTVVLVIGSNWVAYRLTG